MPARASKPGSHPQFRANLIRVGLALLLASLAISVAWNARHPDLSARQEKAEQMDGALDFGHSLGQTFTAAQDHLAAVQLFFRLAPGAENLDARITLHLRQAPNSSTDLAVASLPLSAIQAVSGATFSFQPQFSRQRELFILLETDAPPNQIFALTSRSDSLFDGALYVDGRPTAKDLAFRTYSALNVFDLLMDLLASGTRLGEILVIFLAFILLGGSLLALFSIRWPGDAIERIALAAACGLSLPPLLFAVCAPLGLRLPPSILRGIGIGLLLLALGKSLLQWRRKLANRRQPRQPVRQVSLPAANPEAVEQRQVGLTMAGLFLLALLISILQIQDIYAPQWIDGLTHAHTIQQISQNSGLESGELYHVGFHAVIVFLQAFWDIPTAELMLIVGQAFILLGGLTLYTLAHRIFLALKIPSASFAALASVMALWFFARFPVYLMNWGRYPLMQGMALLPAALAAALHAIDQRKMSSYALAAYLLAGLFLSHYGMLSFYGTFLVVWLGSQAWQNQSLSLPRLRQALQQMRFNRRVWLLGGAALLIFLLIGWRFLALLPNGALQAIIEQSRQNVQELNYSQIMHISLQGGGLWLACAGLIGLLLAGWKYRPAMYLLIGWIGMQTLLIALQAPFLGQAVASYANLLLLLSLPLAVFAGLLFQELFTPWRKDRRPAKSTAGSISLFSSAWLALLGLALAGSLTQIGIINPATNLYTIADHQAAQWIEENTPPQANFLINSNYWGAARQAVVACDGGGWIEAMSGRQGEYLQDAADPHALDSFVRAKNISYVYLGLFPGFLDQYFLPTEKSAALPGYSLIYQQDGVRIYRRDEALPGK